MTFFFFFFFLSELSKQLSDTFFKVQSTLQDFVNCLAAYIPMSPLLPGFYFSIVCICLPCASPDVKLSPFFITRACTHTYTPPTHGDSML